MKRNIVYILISVILCAGFFYLGWYECRTTLNQKINNTVILNEYDKYVSSLDATCPFISTVDTSDCLDEQINKQKQQYNLLSKEIIATAKTETEKAKAQNEPLDLEILEILFDLPTYDKTRDTYIEQLCSLKLASITGTAIVEESRKCLMYYNSKDIQMLENLKTDEEKIINN